MKKTINKISENFNKIGEKMKGFGNKNDNELLIIGMISILIFIWIIIYLIPNIFVSLFNTFLGKIILILILMLVSFKNLNYGIILLLIFIIIYRFLSLSITMYSKNGIKEGFTWNQTSKNNFLGIQQLINPEIVFDVSEIQKQASQEEVNYFNKHGYWPWSDKVKQLYKETLDNNPYVRTNPEDAIKTIRTIYNEKAILEMLSWQAKEGRFLLNGVGIHGGKENPYVALPNGWGDFAFNSGQISSNNNVIKCGYNKDGSLSMQEIIPKGNDGILYNHVKKILPIDYKNLENIIPGFSFLNKPCNPCDALNNPPDYNCRFKLDLRGSKKGISPVWKYLWNL
jgi:hypothetical protein